MPEKFLVWAKPFLAGATHIAMAAGFSVSAGDLVADLDPRHRITDREHIAGHLVTRNERKLNQMTVGAVAHQEVVITDAAGADTDEHLVTTRLRRRWPALGP